MSGLGAGKLIMIVEDNDKNLKLARDVLRFHDFRTIEVTRGEDCVALASENVPDLILMDVALPGLDGVDATRQLKTEPSTTAIPVVALTASLMRSDRDRITEAGFAGVIAKPIDILRFSEQVLAYCRSSNDA
jgi:two-component system, cell cycle response regulator DivK